jgi:hypothetical protein
MKSNPSDWRRAVAVHAAQLIVDEGMDWAAAKAKAARQVALGQGQARSSAQDLPTDDEVEDEVREHLQIFHGDTHAAELLALRRSALRLMRRIEQESSTSLRPHLANAAWRGTATRRSALTIELYADDPKMAELALLNLGVTDVVGGSPDGGSGRSGHSGRGGDPLVMATEIFDRDLGESIVVAIKILDADDLRGALKPDARGRTWRGSVDALTQLVAQSEGPTVP